jgi:hypothetical protein
MSRSNVRIVSFTAFFALAAHVACGDVTSDLITDASGGSTTGGAAMGGSAMGGAAGGGTTGGGMTGGGTTGGGTTGGSATGGSATGGSSTGGTSAGSGGTPECTTNDDCSGSERNICRVDDGVCVECTGSDVPCEPDEDCSEVIGECARYCASDDDCIDEDDSHCYTAINFCVECLDDSDCPPDESCGNWQCNDP